MVLAVCQTREDAFHLVAAQHLRQRLVLFCTGDAAVVLPLAATHLFVVELDGV